MYQFHIGFISWVVLAANQLLFFLKIDPLSSDSIDVNSSSALLNASNNFDDGASVAAQPPQVTNKGPNLKDALQKDALVRQMGVTPTNQNPNLFRDLLGWILYPEGNLD